MNLLSVVLAQTSVVDCYGSSFFINASPSMIVLATYIGGFFYTNLQGIIKRQNVDNLIVVGFLIRRCTWI